ncbi:hypothetical protein Asp14428_06320 [Actinoplanes sp. NBRC 14428]|nr:hypothetical protein Asp14428_06320 [Actinoplanes sp. NBRC 14428]
MTPPADLPNPSVSTLAVPGAAVTARDLHTATGGWVSGSEDAPPSGSGGEDAPPSGSGGEGVPPSGSGGEGVPPSGSGDEDAPPSGWW